MAKWIFPLILAGTGSAAAAEEARRTLSVTATVIESCTVSTASTSPVACTRGTIWSGVKAIGPLASATASRTVQQGTTYLTITY
jgi:hypothetical protein